ncbi:MAG: hypothetical protein R3C01_09015 [Planctomycetaceae bacterium]
MPEGMGAGTSGVWMVDSIGRLHAEEHKYHLSCRHGYDVGPVALHDWCGRYWRRFCRWRHFEHLTGSCFYPEFESRSHAVFSSPQMLNDPVVCFAVERVRDHLWEYLDFYKRDAVPSHLCRERLHTVLTLMDLNAARLPIPTWGQA